MYKYNTPQELFTAICNKIRDRISSNELINHQDIPDKIDSLVDSDIINEYNKLLSIIINRNIIIELNNNEIENINICFLGCTSLTTIDLPECTSIGNYAFQECTNLTTVNLPECTSIGERAFGYCTSLTTIILSNNQVVTLGNINVFNNSSIANGSGYAYVPDNLVDSYKRATRWSNYANQIKPISELPSELKEEYNL